MSAKVTTTSSTWENLPGTPGEVVEQLVAQGWVVRAVEHPRTMLQHPDLTGVHTVVEP